jgi:hypothetical protein
MLCSADDGNHVVAFGNPDGTFSSPGWWGVQWCNPASLSLGDFNGDGRTDLRCQDGPGRHWIAFSNGNGSFASTSSGWPAYGAWCDLAHTQQGDFNGDGKTDLICNADDGRHILAFANADGTFSSPGWWATPWCDPVHLGKGDFNGDGKTDLLCNSGDGKHIVAFPNGDGSFSSPGWWWNPGALEADSWASNVGNFDPDPSRFPNGLKPVADAAHARGLRFLLWLEPERAMPDTWMFSNHPEWLIAPPTGMPAEVSYMRSGGFHLVNLGIPAARDWLRQKLSGMIGSVGIDIYRQDFNMYPLYFWRSLDAPDRQGMTEILLGRLHTPDRDDERQQQLRGLAVPSPGSGPGCSAGVPARGLPAAVDDSASHRAAPFAPVSDPRSGWRRADADERRSTDGPGVHGVAAQRTPGEGAHLYAAIRRPRRRT